MFRNKGRKQKRQREKEQPQELQTEAVILSPAPAHIHKGTLRVVRITVGRMVKCSLLQAFEDNVAFDEVKTLLHTAATKLIGSTATKLQEVLYKVCKLDADLMFTYGSFGYGHSHQTILSQHVPSERTRCRERRKVQDICWCSGLHGEERQDSVELHQGLSLH
ncbi:hypothetical protein AOLI_G00130520 [Acnodon oligacanthus]